MGKGHVIHTCHFPSKLCPTRNMIGSTRRTPRTPMRRAGQPFELAPTYVYLASDDSGYVAGQVLHVNGGTMTET